MSSLTDRLGMDRVLVPEFTVGDLVRGLDIIGMEREISRMEFCQRTLPRFSHFVNPPQTDETVRVYNLSFPDFIAFLKSKGASEPYSWEDCFLCPVANYLRSKIGERFHPTDVNYGSLFQVRDPENRVGETWPYRFICQSQPHYYGAAYQRALRYCGMSTA